MRSWKPLAETVGDQLLYGLKGFLGEAPCGPLFLSRVRQYKKCAPSVESVELRHQLHRLQTIWSEEEIMTTPPSDYNVDMATLRARVIAGMTISEGDLYKTMHTLAWGMNLGGRSKTLHILTFLQPQDQPFAVFLNDIGSQKYKEAIGLLDGAQGNIETIKSKFQANDPAVKEAVNKLGGGATVESVLNKVKAFIQANGGPAGKTRMNALVTFIENLPSVPPLSWHQVAGFAEFLGRNNLTTQDFVQSFNRIPNVVIPNVGKSFFYKQKPANLNLANLTFTSYTTPRLRTIQVAWSRTPPRRGNSRSNLPNNEKLYNEYLAVIYADLGFHLFIGSFMSEEVNQVVIW
jgi:hypothetical protein